MVGVDYHLLFELLPCYTIEIFRRHFIPLKKTMDATSFFKERYQL